MKQIQLLMLVILCFIGKIAWGQSDENVTAAVKQERILAASTTVAEDPDPLKIACTMPSPNTNFAIRDIDIAADKYTGIANIRIPIYTLEVNNSSMPIELNYTTSGIRADDVTSIVGLGWRLSAGGEITRSIRGKPDNPNRLENIYTSGPWDGRLMEIWLQEQWDTQPDQYYFELPNLSGSFVLDTMGQACLIPYQNIKIEYKDYKFKIIDDQGTCYFFSTCDKTDVVYTNVSMPEVVSYDSPWYLDKIEYLNGDKVELYYELDSKGSNTTHFQHLYSVRAFYNNSSKQYEMLGGKYCDLTQNTIVSRPHYLSKIVYKDQQVEFVYERESSDIPFGKRLTDIIVKHIRGLQTTQVRRFKFLYDRFDHDRLKLSGIKEIGTEQLERPICNFEYFEDVTAPTRDSYGIDHWGYFRSNTTKPDQTFPSIKITCDIDPTFPKEGVMWFSAERTPNLQYTRVQSLKKIVYPSGGSTELIYELHRGFDKQKNKDMDAGGLRIKQIIKRSSQTDAPMIYKYEYEGGVVYDDQKNYILSQQRIEQKDINAKRLEFNISNTNLSPSIDYYGASVVYAAVKEYLPNESYIRYDYVPYDKFPDLPPTFSHVSFGNCPTNMFGDVKNSITPKSSRSWGRNLLQSKTSYNRDGVRIDSITYQYTTASMYDTFIPGHTLQGSCYDDGGPFDKWYLIGMYANLSTSMKLVKMTVHKGCYSSGAQTTYTYNPATVLLCSTTEVDSDGTSIVTTYTYPQDFNITDTTTIIGKLKQRNVCIPLEKITSRNGKVVAATGKSFRFNEMNNKALVLDCEKSLKDASPIAVANFPVVNCTSSKITFNNYYKDDRKYLDYNADGQLLCYQDDDGVNHSFVFRNSTQPIATVLNARHSENPLLNQVYFNDFETEVGSPYSRTKSGEKSIIWSPGRTYTIDEKLAPGSYILTFWSDATGIMGMGKVTRKFDVINASSYPAISFLTGYVDDVSILPPNATLTSAVYVPGWGNISESDERGQTTYTEYNSLGLPVTIKDNDKKVVRKFEYQ